MSELWDWGEDGADEPERYELGEPPAYSFALDRRVFLESIGGGIAVLLTIRALSSASAHAAGAAERAAADPIATWLHIDERGKVTAFTGKVEVGQGIRTSLSQVVAEELGCPVESVSLVMGDTDLTPFDRGTFGSRTTPSMAPQLRRVAAAARELLVERAAARWGVEAAAIEVRDGAVVRRETGERLGFGTLTAGEKLLHEIDEDAATIPPENWKIAGTPVRNVNARALVTGEHRYASDITRPGMLHGAVLRPPTQLAELSSVDTSEAEAIAGVVVVHDGEFVGAAAPTRQLAARAISAVHAEWRPQPLPTDGDGLFEFLENSPAAAGGRGRRGRAPRERGSIEDGLAAADIRLEHRYRVAYIAHAPLEPRAAVAEWSGDRLTVWTGTQRPFGARSELSRAFRMPEERVHVIVPDTGAGYGGKHTNEAAIEAARLARAAGKPVKLRWTREEEFTRAYFRPAGVISVASGIKEDGTLVAWDFHNYNSGGSAIQPLYDIPNQRVLFHRTRYPLRQGSYRGLAATANHFARETHLDELAHAVGIDPLALRLKNLTDERLRAVLEAAAERFGWGHEKAGAGRGFGIAGGFEKGSYVATCVEVAVEKAGAPVEVVRAVTAFECGAIVNPDNLRNQVEGAMIMGIGGALFENVRFDADRIQNPRFSSYRLPRFKDVPELDTVLIDREDLPSAGAGETPIVAIAPAIGNAIFAATGERRRSMPLQ